MVSFGEGEMGDKLERANAVGFLGSDEPREALTPGTSLCDSS